MPDSWLATNASGVVDSVVAAIISVVSPICFQQINRSVATWFRLQITVRAYIFVGICFLGVYCFPGHSSNLDRGLACLAGAAFLSLVFRALLRGYDDVGFGTAFYSTQKGVSFEKSLRMAEKSMDFLGIGAGKLTSTPDFTAAMERCGSGGRTVRMLLWRPEGPLLQTLAKRNEVDPLQYARNVRASLKIIANVKFAKDLDIQVRFYPVLKDKDLRFFRLMFLNQDICLWSWTDWGKHIGRDNPQVVLMNRAKNGSQRSAFQAFQDYFNRLWEDQTVVVAKLEEYREEV